MLTPIGWINGLSSVLILIFGCASGLFFIYQSRRTNAKLLFHAGIMLIFAFLAYSGSVIDFIAILLTNENIDNSFGIVGILNFSLIFIGGPFFLYFNSELVIPGKNKIKYLVASYGIITAFLIDLFIFLGGITNSSNILQPNYNFTFIYPENSGDDLIDANLTFGSPVFILAFAIGFVIMGYCGIGYLYKYFQSEGVVRKKFMLLFLAIFLYIPGLMIDNLIYLEAASIFPSLYGKISVLGCSLLWYFGLREEPAEPKKERFKKETQVEGELFRLYKRPSHITEEEVSVSKEKKICLVCKGKLAGFKLAFICPNCDTLYCENCARALSDLENLCWVCNNPFDESKPVKPYEKEKEVMEIEEQILRKSKEKQDSKSQKSIK